MTCLEHGATPGGTRFLRIAPGGHVSRHHARTFDSGCVGNKAETAAIHFNPTFDPLNCDERAIQSVIEG